MPFSCNRSFLAWVTSVHYQASWSSSGGVAMFEHFQFMRVLSFRFACLRLTSSLFFERANEPIWSNLKEEGPPFILVIPFEFPSRVGLFIWQGAPPESGGMISIRKWGKIESLTQGDWQGRERESHLEHPPGKWPQAEVLKRALADSRFHTKKRWNRGKGRKLETPVPLKIWVISIPNDLGRPWIALHPWIFNGSRLIPGLVSLLAG